MNLIVIGSTMIHYRWMEDLVPRTLSLASVDLPAIATEKVIGDMIGLVISCKQVDSKM